MVTLLQVNHRAARGAYGAHAGGSRRRGNVAVPIDVVRQMATEIRFAFALNGGVSLAIWIGGVVDEVLRFVDAGKRVAHGEPDDTNPYTALCQELGVLPTVDVLAGSSAGGSERGVPRHRGHPRLHRPAPDQAALVGPRLVRPTAPPADRQLARLTAERRPELPALHRGGVRGPGRERDRVRRRRSRR